MTARGCSMLNLQRSRPLYFTRFSYFSQCFVLSQKDPEIHLMNPGKQTVLHLRSAQHSFTGLCEHPDIQRNTADGSRLNCILFSSNMHVLNPSIHFLWIFGCLHWIHACIFLEYTHAEPKFTCAFPSRNQWAVVTLNNSCSDDPYVQMTITPKSMIAVMVTVISTRLCFVRTVVQASIKREEDIWKTFSSSFADP
jgi:hypothetical protein